MDAISLDGAGNRNQILIEHGHKRRVITSSDLGKDGLEGADVIGSVIGRQRDAGHQHRNVRMHQRAHDLVEIGAGLRRRQAAQTIVAAELDDDDGRMQAKNKGQSGNGVFGGGAARASVDDLVMIASIVENLL